MKKLASILVLVFAFIVTVQAQKKERERGPKLTVEQHTALAIKKMTLGLDLTNKQQDEIKPLITAQAVAKKAAIESRKENRATNKKPSADEIYAIKSKQLDNQIAFKNKMKDILNKEQFEKFKKMKEERKGEGEMKKKGKKGTKKGDKKRH
jgi:Spy/CpxP family protein refolding chaperone